MYATSPPQKGEEFLNYLPPEVLKAFCRIPAETRDTVREIRLSLNGAAAITRDKVYFLKADGSMTNTINGALFTDSQAFKTMLDRMCQCSVYAAQSSLCRGYITLPGGHRAGVCGKATLKDGKIAALSDISSVNIRISREIKGAADKIINYITDGCRLLNTLIISPPACGKTTMLRDASRLLGGGLYNFKVGMVDERCEMAAVTSGQPSNDIGPLTDVYSACPKAEGMEMLLRSMGPDIIITDEIGTKEDEAAAKHIINAGVKLLCSAHAFGISDLKRRDTLSSLLCDNVFERIIVLSRRNGAGTVEKVY